MKSHFQERIIAILQESPNGLTSNEIAERLGATAGNISSCLSKLAAYGIIGKKPPWPKGKRLSRTDRRTSRDIVASPTRFARVLQFWSRAHLDPRELALPLGMHQGGKVWR